MKRFIFFARVYTWSMCAFPWALSAQDLDVYPNYVVIGAFAHHKNAINFAREANDTTFPAKFEMNPHRNLYYVYVLTTDNRDLAIAEAVKLRGETKYFDTWVFSGFLGELSADTPARPGLDINPVTGKTQSIDPGRKSASNNSTALKETQNRAANNPLLRNNDTSDQGISSSVVSKNSNSEEPAVQNNKGSSTEKPQGSIAPANNRLAENNKDTSPVSRNGMTAKGNEELSAQNTDPSDMLEGGENVVAGKDETVVIAKDETVVMAKEEAVATRKEEPALSPENTFAVAGPPPTRASTAPLEAEDVVGKDFYFHLFRADNLKQIGGEVDAIDFERSRKMATYPANQSVTVKMPSGKLHQVSFICQVFGYRKQQKEFDPNNPDEELYLDDSGNLVVPFELVRLQKGDIAIMYNVFFFKDAAVMRPESRYEVNNLLELLKENPGYKIAIHGHTNGNASGKIISMDKTRNFYSLSGTKQGFGSARKLSEERATVIREFLISSGIPENRMIVKAWGGKKPIHDKHSVRANENVRVEIEILPD